MRLAAAASSRRATGVAGGGGSWVEGRGGGPADESAASDPGSVQSMNGTGYKILGYVVWQGGKWYVRRNYGRYVPSGRTAGLAAAAVLAVGAVALLAARRGD